LDFGVADKPIRDDFIDGSDEWRWVDTRTQWHTCCQDIKGFFFMSHGYKMLPAGIQLQIVSPILLPLAFAVENPSHTASEHSSFLVSASVAPSPTPLEDQKSSGRVTAAVCGSPAVVFAHHGLLEKLGRFPSADPMFCNFLEDETVRSHCENGPQHSGVVNDCGSISGKEAICECYFYLYTFGLTHFGATTAARSSATCYPAPKFKELVGSGWKDWTCAELVASTYMLLACDHLKVLKAATCEIRGYHIYIYITVL